MHCSASTNWDSVKVPRKSATRAQSDKWALKSVTGVFIPCATRCKCRALRLACKIRPAIDRVKLTQYGQNSESKSSGKSAEVFWASVEKSLRRGSSGSRAAWFSGVIPVAEIGVCSLDPWLRRQKRSCCSRVRLRCHRLRPRLFKEREVRVGDLMALCSCLDACCCSEGSFAGVAIARRMHAGDCLPCSQCLAYISASVSDPKFASPFGAISRFSWFILRSDVASTLSLLFWLRTAEFVWQSRLCACASVSSSALTASRRVGRGADWLQSSGSDNPEALVWGSAGT